MNTKISVVSLGCSKNLVDSERILHKLNQMGCEIEPDPECADIVIVNTCGFIKSAKEESIQTILEYAEMKKEGAVKKVIVTGCMAERYKDEMSELFPDVDGIIGIGDTKDIADIVREVLDGDRVVRFAPKLEAELIGERIVSTLPFYSYLKIAEGCSNCCTYCAIPMIRGKFRSVPMEQLIAEARSLAERGVKELVVIAQDTARYGEDIYGKPMLPELLKELCKIDGLKWIRTLYCYPERVTDELIETIASEEKLVKYLEIPIQHCDGEILSRMGRHGDVKSLEELFAKIRSRIPGVILRTTLITGFPGETEDRFNTLVDFAERVRFDRLGCFPYSAEEGTKAAEYPDQLSEEIAEERADIIMEKQLEISAENNEKLLGKTLTAVIEGYDRIAECHFGRTAMDAPDIDGKIFFLSKNRFNIGDFVELKITDTMEYDLVGEVIE